MTEGKIVPVHITCSLLRKKIFSSDKVRNKYK